MKTTEASSKKYWAFISYSSKDQRWGKWLHKRLENYPIPTEFQGLELDDGTKLNKHLRPVFRDRDELAGSSELGPAIQAALQQSRFLIVLCSPNAAKSKWVNKEIIDFRSLAGDGKVLALILAGEPNASSNPDMDDALECFPPALRYPMEPMAGDLRNEGDGKERGFLKILSGIADIGFDKLYQRHERIQRKRRLVFATVASIIIAALAGLSAYALNQKSIAEKQTKVAVAQTNKANEKTIVAKKQTEIAERQTKKANEKTKIAKEQTEIAQEKTIEAKRQSQIAITQTKEAKKQKELAERNARETSRKLAQHYQYRANELLVSDKANERADNAMRATVLLTEAMRVSEPFRESTVERLKIQTLLNDKRLPEQLFHHGSSQSFSAFHQHIVLTCGQDHTVQLWDSLSEQQIGQPLRFDHPLTNAVFSNDGEFVAVFDAKYTWVIDCGTGAMISAPLETDSSYQYSDKHILYADRPVTSQVAFIDSKRVAVICSTMLKVFDFTSGKVVASVEQPEDYVFANLFVLDDEHLWINLRPAFGGKRNLNRKKLVVSSTDGSLVRESTDDAGRTIAPRTGTALVFDDNVTYLQQMVDNRRLIEFPTRSRISVKATRSPESTVFLAWERDGDKSKIYMADVDGRKITVPSLDRDNISAMFLLDDQHMLVAYYGSKKQSYQRRLEVWDFKIGQLKASDRIEDVPSLCRINKDNDKVIFSSGKRVLFWDFQRGIHRLSGNHLNNIEQIAFIDSGTCLTSDGGIIKKWKFPTPEPEQKKITWTKGKFDPIISTLAFGGDLIALRGEEDGEFYFSVYDQKQRRLIADSIQITEAKRFHWAPLYFSSNKRYLLIPFWADGDKKRCFIWDTKTQKPAKLSVSVPIRQVVRIDDSEIVFLGDDDRIHFQSLSNSEHKSLPLGPLRDGLIRWSPDRKCVVVEGKDTAFIVNVDAKTVVFDRFFIWPPNETCWLADENAVWCIAKKKFCKINWLTGEVLVERHHLDSADDLTCLGSRNILISKGAKFNGRLRSAASLKFWDLAGNDLQTEIPFNGKQAFFRSADDQFVHVPAGDSFTTVATADCKTTVHSDSFLREHLNTAKIYIGENRNHIVIWPRNGKYRVYDTSTLNAVSKPFSVRRRGVLQPSAGFDNFRMGGEIMTLSTREEVSFYETTTGYKIYSVLVKDHLNLSRDFERNFRVLQGRQAHQLILVNEKKNELALVNMPSGNLTYKNASLKSTVVSEQLVDATNAVVPMSKVEVIQAFKEIQEQDQ